jgi:hypothetical protein
LKLVAERLPEQASFESPKNDGLFIGMGQGFLLFQWLAQSSLGHVV